MKCTELIQTVLSEIYEQIPGSIKEKDALIKAELIHLRNQYKNLTKKGCLDYQKPVTRFAYIFNYVTFHANIVYRLIEAREDLQKIFSRDKVNISCVGGGPGSDILGVLKYLANHDHDVKFLKFLLLDREGSWAESWNDVDEKVAESTFRLSSVYQPFDVLDETTWQYQDKYLSADLFTLIYFMSELFAHKEAAQPYFDKLFSKARQGSIFLFVDNNSSQLSCGPWFDSLCNAHGLKILVSKIDSLQLPIEEEKRDLGEFFDKFGNIRMTANAIWKIAIKE